MTAGRHLTMTIEELYNSSPSYGAFSQARFAKRIDQLKEAAKAFGKTPGQNEASKLPRFNHEKSRKGLVDPYNNDE